jgi:hypothetical protein
VSITLTNIPRIMRAQRPVPWTQGATFLDRWFLSAAAVMPHYGAADIVTVDMDWVLGFKRARSVYDAMLSEKIWVNAASRERLASVLKRQGKLGLPGRAWFGDINLHVPTVHRDQLNFRYVTSPSSPIDGLSAGLGDFALYVAVAGEHEGLKDGRTKISIHQVGIYVRDSFDFEGGQFLGYWDETTNTVSGLNPFAGSMVTNGDFREWRRRTGMGGDFLIYSNMRKIMLSSADTFTIG